MKNATDRFQVGVTFVGLFLQDVFSLGLESRSTDAEFSSTVDWYDTICSERDGSL